MNRAVELLQNITFFLATEQGGQPRVRPFGAVADIDGALCICTSNKKSVFRQMSANPMVELSAMLDDRRWVRIRGKVELKSDRAAKEEFLNQVPMLRRMYSEDDGSFEVFAFTQGTVGIWSLGSDDAETYEL